VVTARPDAPRKVTAAEFLQFPDDFPLHSQLIQGQVVVTEASLLHQRVRDHLQLQIVLWTRGEAGRGEAFSPVDVPINDWNVFAPDVLWYSEARRPPKGALRVDGLPDLAIEVRSPSTWRYDIGPKRAHYERAGLGELWLVDTQSKSVLVYRRSDAPASEFDVALELAAGDTLTSPLLPRLVLDVAEIFDR
jgi:Uma2 family endonuclease